MGFCEISFLLPEKEKSNLFDIKHIMTFLRQNTFISLSCLRTNEHIWNLELFGNLNSPVRVDWWSESAWPANPLASLLGLLESTNLVDRCSFLLSFKLEIDRVRCSTEVAFALPTHPSRVLFLWLLIKSVFSMTGWASLKGPSRRCITRKCWESWKLKVELTKLS